MALGQFTYLSGITKIRPQSPATWCIQFQYGKLTNTLESEQSVVAELNFEHNTPFLRALGAGKIRQFTSIVCPNLLVGVTPKFNDKKMSKTILWKYENWIVPMKALAKMFRLNGHTLGYDQRQEVTTVPKHFTWFHNLFSSVSLGISKRGCLCQGLTS